MQEKIIRVLGNVSFYIVLAYYLLKNLLALAGVEGNIFTVWDDRIHTWCMPVFVFCFMMFIGLLVVKNTSGTYPAGWSAAAVALFLAGYILLFLVQGTVPGWLQFLCSYGSASVLGFLAGFCGKTEDRPIGWEYPGILVFAMWILIVFEKGFHVFFG